jgi:hypothetical protein
MKTLAKKLLIVLALFVFVPAGCQSSAMETQKETAETEFEELDQTPAGVRVPEHQY